MSPSDASALLRAHGLRPLKRWGQNFLCDRNVLERIVRAAELTPQDRTLEIGAGLGALTRVLAERSAFVTAVEIDPLLQPILHETIGDRSNVRLIQADFLELDLPNLVDEAFGGEPGVVVASIPYYITTPILERLFANKQRIARIVLLVQQEVGARLAASPGADAYGAMSVFAQFHTRVEIIGTVSRTVFLPQPEVASAIVRLTPAKTGTVPVIDEATFFRVVRAAFGQRRKTLANALSGGLKVDRTEVERVLAAAGIEPCRRGETLSLGEFASIADGWTS